MKEDLSALTGFEINLVDTARKMLPDANEYPFGFIQGIGLSFVPPPEPVSVNISYVPIPEFIRCENEQRYIVRFRRVDVISIRSAAFSVDTHLAKEWIFDEIVKIERPAHVPLKKPKLP